MTRIGSRLTWYAALLALAMLVTAGCKKSETGPKPPVNTGLGIGTGTGTGTEEAEPEAGPHGGPLAEWAGHKYHVEFTVGTDKKEVVIYILDKKAKSAPAGLKAEQVSEVEAVVKQKPDDVSVKLTHDPAKSGEQGIAFKGAAAKELTGEKFEGELRGKIDGKKMQGEFPH